MIMGDYDSREFRDVGVGVLLGIVRGHLITD
jgi:hypothetical protein